MVKRDPSNIEMSFHGARKALNSKNALRASILPLKMS